MAATVASVLRGAEIVGAVVVFLFVFVFVLLPSTEIGTAQKLYVPLLLAIASGGDSARLFSVAEGGVTNGGVA